MNWFKKRYGFWLTDYGWKFTVLILAIVLAVSAIIIFVVWPSYLGVCPWVPYNPQTGTQAGQC